MNVLMIDRAAGETTVRAGGNAAMTLALDAACADRRAPTGSKVAAIHAAVYGVFRDLPADQVEAACLALASRIASEVDRAEGLDAA